MSNYFFIIPILQSILFQILLEIGYNSIIVSDNCTYKILYILINEVIL